MNNQRLTDIEYREFMRAMTKVIGQTVHKLIEVADEQNIERDDVVRFFAGMFGDMAEVSSFKHFVEEMK